MKKETSEKKTETKIIVADTGIQKKAEYYYCCPASSARTRF